MEVVEKAVGHFLAGVLHCALESSECLEAQCFLDYLSEAEVDEHVFLKGGTEEHIVRLYVVVHDPQFVEQQQRWFETLFKCLRRGVTVVNFFAELSGELNAVVIDY